MVKCSGGRYTLSRSKGCWNRQNPENYFFFKNRLNCPLLERILNVKIMKWIVMNYLKKGRKEVSRIIWENTNGSEKYQL